MNNINNIEKYIEHTLLKQDATIEEVKKLFDEAVEYNFLGVCINPYYVKYARDYFADTDIKVITVIGFPLGANLPEVKAYEAKVAAGDGADELDMVINTGALKDKNYKLVEKDISAVVKAVEGKSVKVILETDLLKREEIIEACKIAVNAGAKFVKTSTGFVKNGIGATIENVKLMYETVSPYKVQVKASAGIRDRETAIRMIEAGAVRIGTSSGVDIVGDGINERKAEY